MTQLFLLTRVSERDWRKSRGVPSCWFSSERERRNYRALFHCVRFPAWLWDFWIAKLASNADNVKENNWNVDCMRSLISIAYYLLFLQMNSFAQFWVMTRSNKVSHEIVVLCSYTCYHRMCVSDPVQNTSQIPFWRNKHRKQRVKHRHTHEKKWERNFVTSFRSLATVKTEIQLIHKETPPARWIFDTWGRCGKGNLPSFFPPKYTSVSFGGHDV